MEKDLSKSKKSKNVEKLKNYVKKIKEMVKYHKDDEDDDNDYKKASSKIKAEEARSFEDQKGKGYVNLSILLS